MINRLLICARCIVLFGALAACPVYPSGAQPSEVAAEEPSSLDKQILVAVYEIDNPVFAATMFTADAAAYPIFYGAVPAAWAGVAFLRDGNDYTDAYLLSLSYGASYLSSTYLKKLFRAPRPDIAEHDPRGRERSRDRREDRRYEHGFPSGHAAMAFALSTSYSLSHPKWYVVAPSLTWATATALSRVWRGRHYPSDILGGAVLGAAIAGGLHLAGPHITPSFLRDEDDAPMMPPLGFAIRFGGP